MKLKNILRESKKEQMMRQLTREEKSGIMDSVAKFNEFGSRIYKTDEIKEMVRAIKEMTAGAANLALQETDDWFDKVSINRNMKSLNNMVKEFKKTAIESNQLNQRLTSLYEDMGHVLNRYYDINEDSDGFANYDDEGKDTSTEFEKDRKTGVQRVKEELKSSDIGKSENSLSKDAAKADEKLNKDEKYKYNEQKNSVFSMPSLVSLAPSQVTKVKK